MEINIDHGSCCTKTSQRMKMRIKIKERTDHKALESAETVASIHDLLVEILLRLPIKSLIRFKSVSNYWLSIISNPQFALRRNPNPNPALGLFLPDRFFARNYKFHYIPLKLNPQNPTAAPFVRIRFTMDAAGAGIVQSCNGLLLCVSYRTSRHIPTYYIYNPTTKEVTTLPNLRNRSRRGGAGSSEFVIGIALAFDPAKSPDYKVVCLLKSENEPSKCQVDIYSSEGGPWSASGGPFTIADVLSEFGFEHAVFWNGAIFWVTMWTVNTLYFNLDEEKLRPMPMPPLPDGWNRDRRIAYFGESCDHLHLVEIYESKIQFNVYEMKRDCSEWFVKYQVDLTEVANAFPEMVLKFMRGDGICRYAYEMSIFSLIRGEKESDDAFLVLQIPAGQAIRYNLVTGNFEKLCDFEDPDLEFNQSLRVYQHIQSLCHV